MRVWKTGAFPPIPKRKIGGNLPGRDHAGRIRRFSTIWEKNMTRYLANNAMRTATAGGLWKSGTMCSWNTKKRRTVRRLAEVDIRMYRSRRKTLIPGWVLSASRWFYKALKRYLR